MKFITEYAEYIVLVIGAIGTYIWNKRTRKQLTYMIDANIELLKYSETIKDQIEVKYEGRTIDNLFVIVIAIWNKGRIEIRKEDFEDNVLIDLGENPINVEISSKKPTNIKVAMTCENGKIEISPFLMNPDDYFTIKVLTDKKIENISVLGRIAGVANITQTVHDDTKNSMLSLFLTVLIMSICSYFFLFRGMEYILTVWESILRLIVTFLVGLTLITITTYFVERKKKFD